MDRGAQSHYECDLISNALMWEVLSGKFMQLRVKYFKGDFDPSSHVLSYRNTMALYSHSDALICKMFHSTLEGNAMKWYASLPSGSVTDFKTLSKEFFKAFFVYKEVKQGKDPVFLIR